VHFVRGRRPSFYAGHGFEAVDALKLRASTTGAVGPPPKGDGPFGAREKWGDYTIQYMVRQPATAPEA
jgi:hypothetical protein